MPRPAKPMPPVEEIHEFCKKENYKNLVNKLMGEYHIGRPAALRWLDAAGIKLKKQKHKKKCQQEIYPESLCWTCLRAYALPDPQGCAWIRKQEHVWDRAINRGNGFFIVTNCSQYKPSPLEVRFRGYEPGTREYSSAVKRLAKGGEKVAAQNSL